MIRILIVAALRLGLEFIIQWRLRLDSLCRIKFRLLLVTGADRIVVPLGAGFGADLFIIGRFDRRRQR